MKRWSLLLLLVLACAKDPMAQAKAAFAAKDLAGAESALAALLAEQPDLEAAHLARLVLYSHWMVDGQAARQAEYQAQVIKEYDWAAARWGLAKDYGNIEASLRSNPQAAAAYEAAHKLLYHD
jgi:predicted negative regulator of RcsB-dependent stress response